ncbi:DNA (cytosine-5-)-methyltransferase [Flavobacteriales bacterium]|jgi:DNA (cytosine-5)-methyltransferase 1|nr:DNA (cytosine-5-)-methyltransferase [Flavobacteriales bacterium]MDA7596307.1 DNA (cytosine-5-)-methyltransferase [Flavobacteriales bacterium]|tara:strand:+ start:1250 stop:2218 length:969 start_codon:yes stop_codon:yes gene_type:complete
MSNIKFKVGSLYAGVGGICLGFKQAGYEISWSNEWDKNACITYRNNFKHNLIEGDIWKINEKLLQKVDVIIAGFPCQSFSVAGYRKGFKDERGTHFFRIIDFIDYHEPKAIFLENVKNLKGHDKGNTFKTIKKSLNKRGYVVYYKIINTKELTEIPQNRERIFIVCFKKNLLNKLEFNFPENKNNPKPIADYLDKNNIDPTLVYSQKFKHFDKLKNEIKSEKTLYQWRRQYVRENKNNLCPTLTANMGTGGHNVPLILQNEIIRKLSPRECFRFQGFPEDFKLPKIAKSHLYKQAGNSVSVPVIKKIADEIKKVINNFTEVK